MARCIGKVEKWAETSPKNQKNFSSFQISSLIPGENLLSRRKFYPFSKDIVFHGEAEANKVTIKTCPHETTEVILHT